MEYTSDHWTVQGIDYNSKQFLNYVLAYIPLAATKNEQDYWKDYGGPEEHSIDLAAQVLVNTVTDYNKQLAKTWPDESSSNKNIIVLLNVDESALHNGMRDWCVSLTKHFNNSTFSGNYIILTNQTFLYANEYENVLSIHWFLHQSISLYTRDNIENLPWSPTSSKVLFLPGKLWKEWRFPALYYFLHSSINNDLKYSCITFEQMQKWYPNADRELMDSWKNVYHSPPDTINDMKHMVNHISRVMDRPWLDLVGKRDFDILPPELYNDVAVEIVPETQATSADHLTEKTFRPIVLGYPFVHTHTLFVDTLETLGFKLYHSVSPISQPSYVNEFSKRDWITEFETCINNTQKVLNNIKDSDLEDIQERIKHNQQQAMKIHQQVITSITNIIPGFNNYADDIFVTWGQTLQRGTHT